MTRGVFTRHIPERRLRALALAPAESRTETAHLERCRPCRAELALMRSLPGAVDPPRRRTPCPSLDRLLALVHADPPSGERGTLERHARTCAACALTLEDATRGAAVLAAVPRGTTARSRVAGLVEKLRSLVAFELPLIPVVVPRSASRTANRGASPRMARGLESYGAGRHVEAIRRLQAALASGEDGADLHFALGLSLLAKSRWPDAAASLEAAVRLAPTRGDLHWFLAQAHLGNAAGDAALRHAELAAARPGPYRAAARALARTLRELVAAGAR